MRAWITACLAAALLVPNAALPQAAQPVPRPEIKVGDRWKFVQIDPLTKAVKDANEQAVLEVAADGFRVEEMAPNGVLSVKQFDPEWNSFQDVKGKNERQLRVQFPLEPGKTWRGKYEWINARNYHGEQDVSYTVGPWERITVAAGVFDVLPIEGKGVWRNMSTGASGIVMEKRWYSPAAKNMVKRAYTSRYAGGAPDQDFVIELKSYELKQ
jgi:hypothetical protein